MGYVSEGSGENLFLVRDGVIHTPSLAHSVLAGITRDSVIRIAADMGLTVREEAIPREWLYIADELFFAGKKAQRDQLRQLYRKLEKTREWVENNYYRLPIERQDGSLIPVHPFWRDYAHHDGGAFFSTHFAEASNNFTEMMFALSALDLPFEAGEHESLVEGTRLDLKTATPLIVFHKEIKEAAAAEDKVPILVSQNFYRHGDRYRQVGGERVDKYIDEEFVVHTEGPVR